MIRYYKAVESVMAQESSNWSIRQWICKHYTEIGEPFLRQCNYCSAQMRLYPRIGLYNHIVTEHSNELTEEEKKDKRTE